MNLRFLSVVVPAYNEAARIARTIDAVMAEMDHLGVDAELLVVDDGSTDRTAQIVDEAARRDPRVRLVQAAHAGKGAAVRRGMLAATGAWRFLADADLSMPIAELRRFFATEGLPGDDLHPADLHPAGPDSAGPDSAGPGRAGLEGAGLEDAAGPAVGAGGGVGNTRGARVAAPNADVLVGSREAPGATRLGEPWSRHAVGRVFNWTVKLLVLRGVDDTQCGFKLFSARAAELLFPLQRLDGFGFDVEILFLARRAGLAVREVPVTWEYGRESKVGLGSGARGFLDLLAIRWNQIVGAYPPAVRSSRPLGAAAAPGARSKESSW